MGFLRGVPWRRMSLPGSLPWLQRSKRSLAHKPASEGSSPRMAAVHALAQAPSILRMTGATAEILPKRGQRGNIAGVLLLGTDGHFPYLPRNRALMC